MSSSLKLKEMENVKLKEDNKKLAKRFMQKKADDQLPFSLLKVNYKLKLLATVNDKIYTWKKSFKS